MVEEIVKRVKDTYTKHDLLGFSSSIDDSKCVSCIQHDKTHDAYVGGAAPDNFVKRQVNEEDNKANSEEEIMNMFAGDDSTQKLATEVKLATVIFQGTKGDKSPLMQLASRQQTKNENSNFNFVIPEACALS